jgi:hypothetical protein
MLNRFTRLLLIAIPLEHTLLPDIDISDQQRRYEYHHLEENK